MDTAILFNSLYYRFIVSKRKVILHFLRFFDFTSNRLYYGYKIKERQYNQKARDDAMLGVCGLNRFDHVNKTGSLGYWVRTSRIQQGIATEATLLLIKFGLEQLNLNRIEIIAEVTNIASQRVAEKAGATRECVLRKRLFLHGEARDAILFAVTQ